MKKYIKPLLFMTISVSILLVGCNNKESEQVTKSNEFINTNTQLQQVLFEEGYQLPTKLATIETDYKLSTMLERNLSKAEKDERINELKMENAHLESLYNKELYSLNKETRIVYKEMTLINYNLMNLLNLSNTVNREMNEKNVEDYEKIYKSILESYEKIKKPLQFMYYNLHYPSIEIGEVLDEENPSFDEHVQFLSYAGNLINVDEKTNDYMRDLTKLIEMDFALLDENATNIFEELEVYAESMAEVSDLYVTNKYFKEYIHTIFSDENGVIEEYKKRLMNGQKVDDKQALIEYKKQLEQKFFGNGEREIFIQLFSETENKEIKK